MNKKNNKSPRERQKDFRTIIIVVCMFIFVITAGYGVLYAGAWIEGISSSIDKIKCVGLIILGLITGAIIVKIGDSCL